MNDDVREWLAYAHENLRTAELCLDQGLWHSSIQNSQQTVEKSLKALCLDSGLPFRRSHNTGILAHDLNSAGVQAPISIDECELLDSVYLPSKYPLGGVVPPFDPDRGLAEQCFAIARRVLHGARASIE